MEFHACPGMRRVALYDDGTCAARKSVPSPATARNGVAFSENETRKALMGFERSPCFALRWMQSQPRLARATCSRRERVHVIEAWAVETTLALQRQRTRCMNVALLRVLHI